MTAVDVDALDKLREQLAAVLAEKFTSEHGSRNPHWDWEKPDGPDNPYHLPVEMAERVEQSPYVVFTAGDGCRSMRMPSCTELAAALLPAVDRIANERAAAELESRAQVVSARAAAEERDSTGDAAEVLDEVSAWLTARAAALRASNGEGTTT